MSLFILSVFRKVKTPWFIQFKNNLIIVSCRKSWQAAARYEQISTLARIYTKTTPILYWQVELQVLLEGLPAWLNSFKSNLKLRHVKKFWQAATRHQQILTPEGMLAFPLRTQILLVLNISESDWQRRSVTLASHKYNTEAKLRFKPLGRQ